MLVGLEYGDCLFGMCGTEGRAQGLVCAGRVSTMKPLPLSYSLTRMVYLLRQALTKLSCLDLNSPLSPGWPWP